MYYNLGVRVCNKGVHLLGPLYISHTSFQRPAGSSTVSSRDRSHPL